MKPRIKYIFFKEKYKWECKGDGISATGETPFRAFWNWKMYKTGFYHGRDSAFKDLSKIKST